MMDSIRGSARIKLELSRNIGAFKAMKVEPPFDGLLQNVVSWYQHKIELHDNLIEIASKFTSGTPQPGVDYAKLTAAMPQITANMEYIDKALYDLTPMFCLLLIDRKPDSKGLVSHLVITTEQRRQLVKRIDSFFGTRLSDKNRNYTIDSAAIIKEFLLGNRKSADDPWQ